ncbi:MAG TPA: extracellular solute-binding protein [Capsulimonadaceae bacterium]|nr:extracellular solute-binding protein [Capsulimonadaceae bacterium]
MKQVIIVLFLLFVAMYAGAEATIDRHQDKGVTTIRWSTDPNPARNSQMAVYHQMFPHDNATVDPTSGGDVSKQIVQCATGTGPDVIDTGKENMITLVQAGVLLDLTPYAKQMGFDPTKTYPALKDAITYEGKQYRYPANVWANCVVYNKKVFDDHGVPYPKPGWTYADFVKTCEELQNNPSKSGGPKVMAIANYSDTWMVEDLLIGYGGHFYSPDGLVAAVNDKPATDAMQFYSDLIYKYRVVPTPAESSAMSSQGGWGAGAMDWFYSGRAAMLEIGRWFIVSVPQYPNLVGNLGCALLPGVGDRPSSGQTDTRAVGVNAKSPHRLQALQFLSYLASPAYSHQIIEDGDALPPDPDLARTGKQLVDRYENDPAFQQVFIEAEKNARPIDSSPFIDPSQVDRWITNTIQEVENNLMTPSQAMDSLADQINQQIRVNLERRPDLQKEYEQVTGKPYTPEWWRSHPASPAGW